MDVNRDNFLRIQQRVASLLYFYNSIFVKYRLCSLHGFGHGSLCKHEIKVCQNHQIVFQFLCLFTNKGTEFCKNSFNFLLFPDSKSTEFIVKLDNCHRFYKQGGTGGGLIMNHAGNISFTIRFYRKTISSVSHGNYKILQICSHILRIHHGI